MKIVMSLMITSMLALTGCLNNDSISQGIPGSQGQNNNSSSTDDPDFSVIVDPPTTNPPDEGTPQQPPAPPQEEEQYGFVINDGESMTSSRNLRLTYNPPFDVPYRRISESTDCSTSQWGDITENEVFSVQKTNQSVAVSVQFLDYDGRVSPCYTKSIIIDEAGPEIIFSKYPSSAVEQGQAVQLVFSVHDAGSGVDTVQCHFRGVSKVCGAGMNEITFPSLATGDYTFQVEARDKFGFSSSKSISFSVTSLYKRMSHSMNVQEFQKVDVLFVIDNSGSMAYEQKNMAERIRNFLNVVKGLDWQIGVTTTDPSSSTYGDGRLVALKGLKDQYILTSAMEDSLAQTVLGNTLQRSETGSGTEQGIYASYRAIERSVAGSGGNRNFIRSDSQLAVVLISDEDESANGTKNDPAKFMDYVQTQFNGQKALSFHSIITRPGDKACLNGQGYSYGYRYEQLSKLTGGVVGDVCASDYTQQLQGIAEGVRNTLKTISLACAPVVSSGMTIHIQKDGVDYTGSYTVQGVNLVFDQALPAGRYSVDYSCLR